MKFRLLVSTVSNFFKLNVVEISTNLPVVVKRKPNISTKISQHYVKAIKKKSKWGIRIIVE